MCVSQPTWAQEAVIEFGKKRITINEYFTISLKVRNQAINQLGDFPEIEGFKKSTRTRTKSRINTGKQSFIEETITQNYAAYKEGDYLLKSFIIQLNSKEVTSRGTTIQVDPMPEEDASPVTPPLPALPIAKEGTFTNSQSFFSLEADKAKVYVGEGVRTELAFFVSLSEQGVLDFYDFANQFASISRQLKQKNAWEEAVDLGEIKPDTVIRSGKGFLRFRLAESIYFPLTNQALVFPAVSLKMNQLATEEAYGFPAATQQQLVTFTTEPKRVVVIPLPPHPLKDKVPVGQFRLQEGINQTTFRLGKSFSYTFEVIGEGNLEAVMMPEVKNAGDLDIYPPVIQQRNKRGEGQLIGSKRFRYNLLAKKAGDYKLNDLFSLVFFNPVAGVYDTLKSELTIRVVGAEENKLAIAPEETDSFYQLIQKEPNQLNSLYQFEEIKLYTNVIVLFLICMALFLVFKK
ncbi:BatD family protein [Adhaeribacter aquaticus]|uniref:BatD family protein n=1 Tax=Adhaeribacter aquaticus TaxID=299567 RepID=UPI000417EEAE|nr:BatD family protein [Adhaeribacter aquaticus]